MIKLFSFDVDGDHQRLLVQLPNNFDHHYFDIAARLSVLDGDLVDSFDQMVSAVTDMEGYLIARNGACYGFLSEINSFSDQEGRKVADDTGIDVYSKSLFEDLYRVVCAEWKKNGSLPENLLDQVDVYDESISDLIEMLFEYAHQEEAFSDAWFFDERANAEVDAEGLKGWISQSGNVIQALDRGMFDCASLSVDSMEQATAEYCLLLDFNPKFDILIWLNYTVQFKSTEQGLQVNFVLEDGRKMVPLLSEHSKWVSGMNEDQTLSYVCEHLAMPAQLQMRVAQQFMDDVMKELDKTPR